MSDRPPDDVIDAILDNLSLPQKIIIGVGALTLLGLSRGKVDPSKAETVLRFGAKGLVGLGFFSQATRPGHTGRPPPLSDMGPPTGGATRRPGELRFSLRNFEQQPEEVQRSVLRAVATDTALRAKLGAHPVGREFLAKLDAFNAAAQLVAGGADQTAPATRRAARGFGFEWPPGLNLFLDDLAASLPPDP
jgi:hypothetical protein